MLAGTGSSRGNNSPVAARIETDPSQATAWQMQSSVRHVQAPGGSAYGSKSTPPQQSGVEFTPAAQPGPFRGRSASIGSQQGMDRMARSTQIDGQ